MITTLVFSKTLKAYNDGFRIVANRGSTRSSKTFSNLQLSYLIANNSKKQRIITVVSHSFPHLHGGAIRDFEHILETEQINIDQVRTKNPYIYNIQKSLIEFVGFDRPGKAIGAARDILHINEADKMPFSICHHLIQRTRELVLMDWNPAQDFWFDTEGFESRPDCKVIHSTFFDNIQNLTPGQLDELKSAQRKALAEDAAGVHGYWWNWWQVYGLGLKGQLEGVIFHNWKEYLELPAGVEYYKMFVIDWGGNDPTTLTELNIDGNQNRLYIKEHIYTPQVLNSKLIAYLLEVNPENHPVICDSARKDKKFELQMAGINTIGSTKGEGSIIDGIERMQEFSIFVHSESKNAIREFSTYKWIKDELTGKSLNEPEDCNDHIIDPVRYGCRFYRKNVRPLR